MNMIENVSYPRFGARLKLLRERSSVRSQSELARIVGVTPQAAQKWEGGHTVPAEDKRKLIAAALGTTVRELVRDTELESFLDYDRNKLPRSGPADRRSEENSGNKNFALLPLYSWSQVSKWGLVMEHFKFEEALDYFPCPFLHGPNAFVMEISGEGNVDVTGGKSYAPGEFIYVDPQVSPVNRSMIVVRYDESRTELKQLLTDEGNVRILRSLNPAWPPPESMPEGAAIIGVVIGKFTPE